MLYDPARHEPLIERHWDERHVRDAIARIADVTFVPVAFDQRFVAGGVVKHQQVRAGLTSAPCDDRPLTD